MTILINYDRYTLKLHLLSLLSLLAQHRKSLQSFSVRPSLHFCTVSCGVILHPATVRPRRRASLWLTFKPWLLLVVLTKNLKCIDLVTFLFQSKLSLLINESIVLLFGSVLVMTLILFNMRNLINYKSTYWYFTLRSMLVFVEMFCSLP